MNTFWSNKEYTFVHFFIAALVLVPHYSYGAQCTYGTEQVNQGDSKIFYKASAPSHGQTCESIKLSRKCGANGQFEGDATYSENSCNNPTQTTTTGTPSTTQPPNPPQTQTTGPWTSPPSDEASRITFCTNKLPNGTPDEIARCVNRFKNDGISTFEKACSDSRKTYDEKVSKYSDACAKSTGGSNASSCASRIENCQTNDENDGDSEDSGLFGRSGPLGNLSMSLSGPGKNCSITGKDYFSVKRDAERDINDANKAKREANKTIKEAGEERTKKSAELAKELEEKTKSIAKEKEDNQSEIQKLGSEMLKTESAFVDRKNATESEISGYKDKINQSIMEAEAKMYRYDSDLVKSTCIGEIEKYKSENKLSGGGDNNMSSFAAKGNSIRNTLTKLFRGCRDRLNAEKKALIYATERTITVYNKAMAIKQDELSRAEKALQQARDQYQQNLTKLNAKPDQLDQELTRFITQKQAELKSIFETTQASINDAQAEMSRQDIIIQTKNADIYSAAPPGTPAISQTQSISDAAKAWVEVDSAQSHLLNVCCNKKDGDDTVKTQFCGGFSGKPGEYKPKSAADIGTPKGDK